MDSSTPSKIGVLTRTIPIEDAHLLATLWEEQELRERLNQLNVIAEHIDLNNADLTIVAWEKFLSMVSELNRRCTLNTDNASKNAAHLGIEQPNEDEGIEALATVLDRIDLTDRAGFPGAKIHPARHLVCNIGVLRANTFMKTVYSLVRSTHLMEPTASLVEFVSQLNRHRRMLASEIEGFENRMLMKISSQGYDLQAVDLQTELRDFKQFGIAYWKIDSQVIP